jgi:hypothetical protein
VYSNLDTHSFHTIRRRATPARNPLCSLPTACGARFRARARPAGSGVPSRVHRGARTTGGSRMGRDCCAPTTALNPARPVAEQKTTVAAGFAAHCASGYPGVCGCRYYSQSPRESRGAGNTALQDHGLLSYVRAYSITVPARAREGPRTTPSASFTKSLPDRGRHPTAEFAERIRSTAHPAILSSDDGDTSSAGSRIFRGTFDR